MKMQKQDKEHLHQLIVKHYPEKILNERPMEMTEEKAEIASKVCTNKQLKEKCKAFKISYHNAMTREELELSLELYAKKEVDKLADLVTMIKKRYLDYRGSFPTTKK